MSSRRRGGYSEETSLSRMSPHDVNNNNDSPSTAAARLAHRPWTTTSSAREANFATAATARSSSTTPLPPSSSPDAAANNSNNSSPPQLTQDDATFAERFLLTLEMSCLTEDQVSDLIKTSLPVFLMRANKPLLFHRLVRYLESPHGGDMVLNSALQVLPESLQVYNSASNPQDAVNCIQDIRHLHTSKWTQVVMNFLETTCCRHGIHNQDTHHEASFDQVLQKRDIFMLFLQQAQPNVLQRLANWSHYAQEYPLKQMVGWLPLKPVELQEDARFPSHVTCAAICLLDSWQCRQAARYQKLEESLADLPGLKKKEKAPLLQKQMDIVVKFNVMRQQIIDFGQAVGGIGASGSSSTSAIIPAVARMPTLPDTVASINLHNEGGSMASNPFFEDTKEGKDKEQHQHHGHQDNEGDNDDNESLFTLDGIFS